MVSQNASKANGASLYCFSILGGTCTFRDSLRVHHFFGALTNGMWRSVAASTSGHYSITFGEKQHRTDAPGIRAPGSTLLFRRGCPARHPCVSRLPNRQRSAHRAGPKPVPERIQQTARQPVNNCFKMTTPILPWPRIRFAISPVCPLSYRSQQWFKMHPTTVSSRRISS